GGRGCDGLGCSESAGGAARPRLQGTRHSCGIGDLLLNQSSLAVAVEADSGKAKAVDVAIHIAGDVDRTAPMASGEKGSLCLIWDVSVRRAETPHGQNITVRCYRDISGPATKRPEGTQDDWSAPCTPCPHRGLQTARGRHEQYRRCTSIGGDSNSEAVGNKLRCAQSLRTSQHGTGSNTRR